MKINSFHNVPQKKMKPHQVLNDRKETSCDILEIIKMKKLMTKKNLQTQTK